MIRGGRPIGHPGRCENARRSAESKSLRSVRQHASFACLLADSSLRLSIRPDRDADSCDVFQSACMLVVMPEHMGTRRGPTSSTASMTVTPTAWLTSTTVPPLELGPVFHSDEGSADKKSLSECVGLGFG